MTLADLGLTRAFESDAEDLRARGLSPARVTAVDRTVFLVRDENGEIPASLTGRFRFDADSPVDIPCVGDWVGVQLIDSGAAAVIRELLPRRTFLRRKKAGRGVDHQMIAANIDTAFIVQSCHFDFNLRRLDRYLVMAADGRIDPVLLLTKTDLVSPEELERMLADIRQAGIASQVLALSNRTGAGVEEFRRLLLPGRTCCLLGSSGVGKSTLINRLLGRELLETKTVSATGEGRHATTRRQLLILPGGAMLIDTPGMRELGLLGAGEGVDGSFDEIQRLAVDCRYPDCTHTQEPGCAVLEAVARGELSGERHQSYLKLRRESEHHEMSYLDRRRKDRAFGRYIKSAMKRLKK